MAGLLAWAADVVGANESGSDVSDDPSSIPLILTPQQQQYLNELNQKSASLTRSIQDLRLRLPPSDIAQRLPHLHAHSLASNAALTLQLNSHSSTREQAQQREAKLLEENAAYEREITKCEAKIQEKLQEAEHFQQKLKELDSIEENLKTELQRVQAGSSASQSEKSAVQHGKEVDTEAEEDASRTALLEKLENQKKEMQLMEEKIQMLEKKWADVQEKALKQPSPAQREKALDKQLHSLMEQLAAKQAQAQSHHSPSLLHNFIPIFIFDPMLSLLPSFEILTPFSSTFIPQCPKNSELHYLLSVVFFLYLQLSYLCIAVDVTKNLEIQRALFSNPNSNAVR